LIDRYSIPEMAAIWSDDSRFGRWLEIELLAVEARCRLGDVPEADWEKIRDNASFSRERIDELEKVTRHDVIAFLMSVSESLGPESRHVHYGLTSSDILDTALATQIRDSGRLIRSALEKYGSALADLVQRTRGIPCMGRTHGMHAEPTSVALKFAGHHAEYSRNLRRLDCALAEACVGKLSGAVGTYAHLAPEVEDQVCSRLGLGRETVATQVVPRDRHAAFLWSLASIGCALERFATEVRHLQRTEVGEAEEPFGKGQRGSSAMPHKRNPIVCERLCGFARLLRGYLQVSLEDVNLWHERDISHSSAERFVFPDACGVALYAIRKAAEVAEGLEIFPEGMARNLALAGDGYYSQTLLLAMVDGGADRNEAYAVVQALARKATENGTMLLDEALADRVVTDRIGGARLREICSLERHLRMESEILERAGLGEARG
jgi:adenylosuccinate lyase